MADILDANLRGVVKVPTGIPGFDEIAEGGVPRNRAILVGGTAGSGKTIFSGQYLVEGVRRYNEAGVFVTFEDDPAEIRRGFWSFGWDIEDFEKKNKWIFVDAAPRFETSRSFDPQNDIGTLASKIKFAIQSVRAKRVVLDSLSSMFAHFVDLITLRQATMNLFAALRACGVTSLATAERLTEDGPPSRFGVKEFAADGVVVLRNSLIEESRRRTIEILKFRGASHYTGLVPFSIDEGSGMRVGRIERRLYEKKMPPIKQPLEAYI